MDISKEKLHYFEFVRPIEDILKKKGMKFFTKHYKQVSGCDLKNADKVIICGTSLADNEFVKDLNYFLWIKNYEKPILGICGGMQIIGLVFGGKLNKKTEIDFYNEEFKEKFLGLEGKQEVYHLHNSYVIFGEEFNEFTDCEINQAIKHQEREIYGVLFHPEVRQKDLIINFCNL